MENKNNQSLISDLIVLALADDKITQSEYDFILRLANRMEMSQEEVEKLFVKPLPSKPIFTELERLTHFHKLVLLMNVDRETHEKEIIVIKNFGLKMGIRAEVIDQVLARMNDYEDKVIPSSELIKIFQTFYN